MAHTDRKKALSTVKPIHSYTQLLIDLDDTVYPVSSGIWPLFRRRIDTYLHEHMGFDPQEIPTLRERLFNTYGTTLRGLQVEFEVDSDAYLEYVHDVPLEGYLHPDPALREALASLPLPKSIFTNASRKHAQTILGLLGIADQFDVIVDIMDIAPHCKPHPEAFQVAMRLVGISNSASCLFVDDNLSNCLSAKALGLTAVRVGAEGVDGIPSIPVLADLPTLLKG